MTTSAPLRNTVFSLVIALSAVAGAAHAQMRSADANGDGIITKAEHDAQSEARFGRMDQNHDGVIDAAELAQVKQMLAGRAPQLAAMLDKLDANGDGKITHAEHKAGTDALFAIGDTNHDGKWDAAEVAAMKAKMGGH